MPFNVGAIIAKLRLDTSEFSGGIRSATAQAKAFEKNILGSAAAFQRVGVGMMAVGGIAAAGLVKMSIAAAQFQAGMANVSTLVNTSIVDMKAMQAELLNLPSILGDATANTKALYQALSAGVEPAAAVKFVGEAALFAKAGLTSTFEAVDVMTSVLNAYGLAASDAGKISDQMFETVRLGKTTVGELAASIGQIAPIAAVAGVSFVDLNAAVAALTLTGLKTSEALTSIKSTISNIIAPSVAAQKVAEALGIELSAVALKEKGLVGFLTDLRKRMEELKDPAGFAALKIRVVGENFEKCYNEAGKLTKEGRRLKLVFEALEKGNTTAAFAQIFGSIESLNGVMAMTGPMFETLIKDQVSIAGAAGTTRAAFEKQEKAVSALYEAWIVSINKVAIRLGAMNEGPVATLLTNLLKLTEALNGYIDANKTAASAIMAVAAASSVLTLGAGGFAIMLSMLPRLVEGYGILKVAVSGSTAAMIANQLGVMAVNKASIINTSSMVTSQLAFRGVGSAATAATGAMIINSTAIAGVGLTSRTAAVGVSGLKLALLALQGIGAVAILGVIIKSAERLASLIDKISVMWRKQLDLQAETGKNEQARIEKDISIKKKSLNDLESNYKKLQSQLLKVPANVTDPELYQSIVSGQIDSTEKLIATRKKEIGVLRETKTALDEVKKVTAEATTEAEAAVAAKKKAEEEAEAARLKALAGQGNVSTGLDTHHKKTKKLTEAERERLAIRKELVALAKEERQAMLEGGPLKGDIPGKRLVGIPVVSPDDKIVNQAAVRDLNAQLLEAYSETQYQITHIMASEKNKRMMDINRAMADELKVIDDIEKSYIDSGLTLEQAHESTEQNRAAITQKYAQIRIDEFEKEKKSLIDMAEITKGIWQGTGQAIGDSFRAMFEEGGNAGQKFVDAMKNMLLDVMAGIIAQSVTQWITSLMTKQTATTEAAGQEIITHQTTLAAKTILTATDRAVEIVALTAFLTARTAAIGIAMTAEGTMVSILTGLYIALAIAKAAAGFGFGGGGIVPDISGAPGEIPGSPGDLLYTARGGIIPSAAGGWTVPGIGNKDSVLSALTPREMVLPVNISRGLTEAMGRGGRGLQGTREGRGSGMTINITQRFSGDMNADRPSQIKDIGRRLAGAFTRRVSLASGA